VVDFVPISGAAQVTVEDEPGVGMEQADTSRVLGSAIRDLPGQERLAFGLVYSENMPPSEAAFALGITGQRLGEVLEGALRHLRGRADLAAEVG
jgi:DNA-directed RNA polymerase specialized sigma24 family protein